jgi:hypothetical protein
LLPAESPARRHATTLTNLTNPDMGDESTVMFSAGPGQSMDHSLR